MSVDEDVEDEEGEGGRQRVEGEGDELVVDDEVARSQELAVLQVRDLPLLRKDRESQNNGYYPMVKPLKRLLKALGKE